MEVALVLHTESRGRTAGEGSDTTDRAELRSGGLRAAAAERRRRDHHNRRGSSHPRRSFSDGSGADQTGPRRRIKGGDDRIAIIAYLNQWKLGKLMP